MKKKTVAALGVGAAVGAGLGILFAPKSGKETREELKTKITELRNKVKDKTDNLKNSTKEIREMLENLKSKGLIKN